MLSGAGHADVFYIKKMLREARKNDLRLSVPRREA